VKPLGPVPKLPPLAGSKASQRLEAKRQLERDRQLRERVVAAQVAVEAGEQVFYFVTRKNRLRRLELSAEQAGALEQGRLAVVERPDPAQIEHALVPAVLATELLTEFPRAVRFLNAPGASVGFLTDEEVRNRAAAEAAETPEERAAADAPESAEERAEAEARAQEQTEDAGEAQARAQEQTEDAGEAEARGLGHSSATGETEAHPQERGEAGARAPVANRSDRRAESEPETA